MLEIFIDADGYPVKQEVYRVAKRYGLKVTLVSNSRIGTAQQGWLEVVIVEGQFDPADDWIVEHVSANDIVIPGDISLASRCLEKNARVLSPSGRIFTEESIGEALASRELLFHLPRSRDHNRGAGSLRETRSLLLPATSRRNDSSRP